MKTLGMDGENIESLASDRVRWLTKVWNGVKTFEVSRVMHVRLMSMYKTNSDEKGNKQGTLLFTKFVSMHHASIPREWDVIHFVQMYFSLQKRLFV